MPGFVRESIWPSRGEGKPELRTMPSKRSAREKFLEENNAAAQSAPALPSLPKLSPEQPSATIASSGDITISNGQTVRESIVAAGHLVIGRLSAVENSVIANAGAELRDGARVEGELTVTGTLHWGYGADVFSAVINGPIITGKSLVRATSLIAPNGIHSGSGATTGAVVR